VHHGHIQGLGGPTIREAGSAAPGDSRPSLASSRFSTVAILDALHDIMDPYRDVVRRVLLRRRLDARGRSRAMRIFPWTHHSAAETWYWRRETAWRSCRLRTFWGSGYDLRWKVRNFDALGFVVVGSRDDLGGLGGQVTQRTRIGAVLTSMISSLGNERKGMSAALQAMR